MTGEPISGGTVLVADGLSKSFGGVKALDKFSFQAHPGEVVGLMGPNGAGKTTLFNILTGFLRPDAGHAEAGGKRLDSIAPHCILARGVARTFQELRLIGGISALDNVLLGFPGQQGEYLSRLWLVPGRIASQEKRNLVLAHGLLEQVGLAQKHSELAQQLSYGQQKLLTIACMLATGADVLLLDEPVAGVHPKIIKRILALIKGLAGEGRTVVLIEHNTRAMERVATRLIFMDQGVKVAEGTPAAVLADKRVLEAYLV